jgi:hypothetical protein
MLEATVQAIDGKLQGRARVMNWKPLTPADIVHCVAIADRLDVPTEEIAADLGIAPALVESIRKSATSQDAEQLVRMRAVSRAGAEDTDED